VDQWQLEKLALAGLKNELFFYTPGVDKAANLAPSAKEASQILNDGFGNCYFVDLPIGARVALVPEDPTYMPALWIEERCKLQRSHERYTFYCARFDNLR